MKKDFKKMILAIMLSSVILTCSGCSGKETQSAVAESTTSQSSVAESTTSQSQTNLSQSIDAFGVVEANITQSICISFPAIIESINVQEGQKVKKGDVLITLNMSEYQKKIKAKQLELESEERLLTLRKSRILKETDPDLDKLIYSKKSDIEASKAKINTLKSDLAIMEEKLNRSCFKESTIICSVAEGLVRNISFASGSILQEGNALLDIVDLSSMVVVADVDESFIKDVKLGATAEIIPLADKSKRYKGTVSRISDMAIIKNGQTFIQVEIKIKNNDGFLKLDYNTDIKINKE